MKCPYLLIGYCQRAHGVLGEVLVKNLSDDDARFFKGLSCQLMSSADTTPHGQLKIVKVRSTPQGLILAVEGIETREAAGRLAGTYLAVSRENAVELEDEYEFYSGDLIGAHVKDLVRGELGRVTDIMNAGSGDILVVRKQPENDLLIPFRRAIVHACNPEEDMIIVELPEGLFELYRKASNETNPR